MTSFHSYSPANGHGLPFNPFKALISPRPIGWISSVSAKGAVNLAPYSFFNALSDTPPILAFCSGGWKDSVTNIKETGAFVHNVTTRKLADKVNASSGAYAHGINEMDKAGIAALPSDLVKPPRVADAVASMECRLISITQLDDASGNQTNNVMVIGEVVRIHINQSILKDGMVDEASLGLIARMGYFSYSEVETVFEMHRPKA